MNSAELDELAAELFDDNAPSVTTVTRANGDTFRASFTRQFVETDEIAGVRSVILAPSSDLTSVSVNDTLTVDGTVYKARVIEPRGRALTAVVLGT